MIDPSDAFYQRLGDPDWVHWGRGSANALALHKPTGRLHKFIINHGRAEPEVATGALFAALGLPHSDVRHEGHQHVSYRFMPELRDHTIGKVGANPARALDPQHVLRVAAVDWLAAVEDRHSDQFAVRGDKLHSFDHGAAAHPRVMDNAPDLGRLHFWTGVSLPAAYSHLVHHVLPDSVLAGPLPTFAVPDLEALVVRHARDSTQGLHPEVQAQAVEAAKRRVAGYHKAASWGYLPRDVGVGE